MLQDPTPRPPPRPHAAFFKPRPRSPPFFGPAQLKHLPFANHFPCLAWHRALSSIFFCGVLGTISGHLFVSDSKNTESEATKPTPSVNRSCPSVFGIDRFGVVSAAAEKNRGTENQSLEPLVEPLEPVVTSPIEVAEVKMKVITVTFL